MSWRADPEPVPAWACELVGAPEDFEEIQASITLSPRAVALNPEGFGWWLDAELADLRRGLVDAYYAQREET